MGFVLFCSSGNEPDITHLSGQLTLLSSLPSSSPHLILLSLLRHLLFLQFFLCHSLSVLSFCLICLIVPLALTQFIFISRTTLSAYAVSFLISPNFFCFSHSLLCITFSSLLPPSALFPIFPLCLLFYPSLDLCLSIILSCPILLLLLIFLSNRVPQHSHSSWVHSSALNPLIKCVQCQFLNPSFFSLPAHSSLNVFHIAWFQFVWRVNTKVWKLLQWQLQTQITSHTHIIASHSDYCVLLPSTFSFCFPWELTSSS